MLFCRCRPLGGGPKVSSWIPTVLYTSLRPTWWSTDSRKSRLRDAGTGSGHATHITDLCLVLPSKDEGTLHTYCWYSHNLNLGMWDPAMYLCYKVGLAKANTLVYEAELLCCYPEEDNDISAAQVSAHLLPTHKGKPLSSIGLPRPDTWYLSSPPLCWQVQLEIKCMVPHCSSTRCSEGPGCWSSSHRHWACWAKWKEAGTWGPSRAQLVHHCCAIPLACLPCFPHLPYLPSLLLHFKPPLPPLESIQLSLHSQCPLCFSTEIPHPGADVSLWRTASLPACILTLAPQWCQIPAADAEPGPWVGHHVAAGCTHRTQTASPLAVAGHAHQRPLSL